MQCSEFDSVPFRGKFYTWKTYRGGEQGTETVVGRWGWGVGSRRWRQDHGFCLEQPLSQGTRVPMSAWTKQRGPPLPLPSLPSLAGSGVRPLV